MRASEIITVLPDWRRDLTARNRSRRTIAAYMQDARYLLEWLVENGDPVITHRELVRYFADLLERPSRRDPSVRVTASYAAKQNRHIRQLFRWLYEENEIEENYMEKVKPPKVRTAPPPVIQEGELRDLLVACTGREFTDIRDTAIVRVLIDTGMRVGELVGIKADGIDTEQQVILVLGKGDKIRPVPYGDKTATALRRYMRFRSRHPRAADPALWIGAKGAMTDSGVRQVLTKRGKTVGVRVHPHLFRHTFADAWLRSGGQETDLMNLAGWTSRAMLVKYGASAAQDRAVAAHRRAGLGDRI